MASLKNETLRALWAKHIKTPAGRRMLFLSMVRPIEELGSWGPDRVANRPARAAYFLRYLNRIRRRAGVNEWFEAEGETVMTIGSAARWPLTENP